MRIKMRVAVHDRHQDLAVGEIVETDELVARDFIRRGYAEPAPFHEVPVEAVVEPEPVKPKTTRRRSTK